jgi:hypothetical protein
MAEAFDSAIRRRLSTIDSIGSNQNHWAMKYYGALRQPGGDGGGLRQPGAVSGGPLRQPGGHSYGGPRGNQQALLNFGKWLQGQGFKVSENPHFGNGRVGGHSKGSRHYSGRAIDVNFAPGTSRREQEAIDRIVGYAKLYGLRSIWRKPQHFNHAHFDY